MWFDLRAAGTAPEQLDGQHNSLWVGLWEALKPEQQFRPATSLPPIPDAPPTPAEASPIHPISIVTKIAKDWS